jgi:hypothetical protein
MGPAPVLIDRPGHHPRKGTWTAAALGIESNRWGRYRQKGFIAHCQLSQKGRMKTRVTLRLDFEGERRLGPGKIALLEAIGRSGSISAAGREFGMAYRRAWLLVDELRSGLARGAISRSHPRLLPPSRKQEGASRLTYGNDQSSTGQLDGVLAGNISRRSQSTSGHYPRPACRA